MSPYLRYNQWLRERGGRAVCQRWRRRLGSGFGVEGVYILPGLLRIGGGFSFQGFGLRVPGLGCG